MKGFSLLLVLISVLGQTASPVHADDSTLPAAGFSASRYEDLWKKSPFAVATEEAAPDSPDYMLVGIANVGGVSYASLLDRKNNEHFLISSEKAVKGLTLKSITRGHDISDTSVVVIKDGAPLTLRLEQAPPMIQTLPGTPGGTFAGQTGTPQLSPGITPPVILMPGISQQQPSSRPIIHFHRPTINVPPPPPPATLTNTPPPK
jgi:hypothetical protein